MKAVDMTGIILAATLAACSDSPTAPMPEIPGIGSTPAVVRSQNARAQVKISVEGMTLVIESSGNIKVTEIVLRLESGKVSQLSLRDSAGNVIAGPVESGGEFTFRNAFTLPAGTSRIGLQATQGWGEVVFATNPSVDWQAFDVKGKRVRMPNTDLRLVLAAYVEISANPASVSLSTPCSTLTWKSTGVTACYAVAHWSGQKALMGSEVVCPSAASLYKLVCFEPEGSSVAAEV